MYSYIINGENKLSGSVDISGSKNTCLAILAASILSDKEIILHNVPNIQDVVLMLNILHNLGAKITLDGLRITNNPSGKTVIIDNSYIKNNRLDYDFAKKMRASVFVMGPLLSRFGEAFVSLPGGCTLGTRGIDLHIMALEKLGAEFDIQNGYVHCRLKNGKLRGAVIDFNKSSVGATENAISAAVLAEGTTIINNAAYDPEIINLVEFLQTLGANITWVERDVIKVIGVNTLNKATFSVHPDRLEVATYASYAAITDGCLRLRNMNLSILDQVKKEFDIIGIDCQQDNDDIVCKRGQAELNPCDIITMPNNGFSTDVQPIVSSVLCLANGDSKIHETIFENRFMYVPELLRLGANITTVDNHNIVIHGVKELYGASVMAADLRSAAALIGCSLVAKGTTQISRIYHLERGYENMLAKLMMCGAKINKIKE